MLKAILVNYNYSPTWLFEYDYDYIIYDRSDSKEYLKDFPQDRIIYTKNIGNVDYDKLGYLIDNYDNLPDIFLWGKTNLFKYIYQTEFDLLEKKSFTPLLTQHHQTYSDEKGPVCLYDKDGMYCERSNLMMLGGGETCTYWWEWIQIFNLPDTAYVPFPPGGNFILTKDKVHMYPKEYYQRMRDTLPYAVLPGEAHFCERSYFLLWR